MRLKPVRPARVVHEPIGGGWCRVTGAGSAATCYWWHERTGKKQWTEPTAEKIRLAGGARKHASPATPQGLADPHDLKSPRGARRLQGESPQSNASSPRSTVPLQLPVLSPRSTTRRSDNILPDTPLKPRLKVGPVPRQRRTEQHRETEREKQRDREAAEHLRRKRLQRQRAAEVSTYAAAFRIIDADGSGSVDPPEVIMALKKMGKKVDESRFWQIFRELDLNNSSTLEYREFELVMDALARKKWPTQSDREGAQTEQTLSPAAHRGAPCQATRRRCRQRNKEMQRKGQSSCDKSMRHSGQTTKRSLPHQAKSSCSTPTPSCIALLYIPLCSDAVHTVRSAVTRWNFCANSWTLKLRPRGTETMRRRLAWWTQTPTRGPGVRAPRIAFSHRFLLSV